MQSAYLKHSCTTLKQLWLTSSLGPSKATPAEVFLWTGSTAYGKNLEILAYLENNMERSTYLSSCRGFQCTQGGIQQGIRTEWAEFRSTGLRGTESVLVNGMDKRINRIDLIKRAMLA